jgi:hypothetical protein
MPCRVWASALDSVPVTESVGCAHWSVYRSSKGSMSQRADPIAESVVRSWFRRAVSYWCVRERRRFSSGSSIGRQLP